MAEEAISSWYEKDRTFNGTGTPRLYTDFAIITCHEIRLVYKLPLCQCQGFIDSLFQIMGIPSIIEIAKKGRMQWQKDREYGRRNYSERGVQRYQNTFGDTMHSREFSRQEQEAMIASGALNKMTSLGPQSRRSA